MKSDKRSGSYLAILQSLEDIKIIIIDVKKPGPLSTPMKYNFF